MRSRGRDADRHQTRPDDTFVGSVQSTAEDKDVRMNQSRIRIRDHVKRLPALTAALAASAAFTPAAVASSTTAEAPLCVNPLLQAFSAWGDNNDYSLAPGGDFEGNLDGWTLSAGATQVDGSEPFGVTGTVGTRSLTLAEGAQVTSPAICIDPTRETLRFFTRSTSDKAQLRVEAVYAKAAKVKDTIIADVAPSTADWQPTGALVNPLAKLLKIVIAPIGMSPTVAYRFTATGGTVAIDDLFIDPRLNR
jgi:hypothetical protein